MLTRRGLLLAAISLAGCNDLPVATDEPAQPISLVDAFVGRSHAAGLYRVKHIWTERRFRENLAGRLNSNTLTLAQDIQYDDGFRSQLTWVFRRSGANTWTGRRDDSVDEARIAETGRDIRMSYVVDLHTSTGVDRLGFNELIYRHRDGRIISEAVVLRDGFPVANQRVEIYRS